MFKRFLATLALLFATAFAFAAVDVNKATEAELDSVKGIGPGTSKLILDERKKAPFKDWNDFITRVKGVGEARAQNLSQAGLTVGGKAYKAAATGSAKAADSKADTAKKADAKPDTAKKAETKADAKADTAKKAEAKADSKAAKADAKADKQEAKAEAKAAKADAKAEKKETKAEAKADAKTDAKK